MDDDLRSNHGAFTATPRVEGHHARSGCSGDLCGFPLKKSPKQKHIEQLDDDALWEQELMHGVNGEWQEQLEMEDGEHLVAPTSGYYCIY